MQTSRTIGLCLFQYAVDHDYRYPDGASSTEVFQKLIDGNYVNDPSIFYWKMSGKVKPASSRLKPENVSWDVTVPLDKNSPDGLPVVFLTGFRIEYRSGGRAVPLPNKSRPSFANRGLAVPYHGNNSIFLRHNIQADGSIPNFISADAALGTAHYLQLTPDGPLSP